MTNYGNKSSKEYQALQAFHIKTGGDYSKCIHISGDPNDVGMGAGKYLLESEFMTDQLD